MNPISRASFLKRLLAGTLLLPGWAALGAVPLDQLRGDLVGWARLKTADPYWNRHSKSDPVLMTFLRLQTTLNLDPVWQVADVQNLGQMCEYPFLFSQGIAVVEDPPSRARVVEYLRRGGFLLVDACCNRGINPDFDVFLQKHEDFFAAELPEAHLEMLPATHEMYRCHFAIPDGHPPHTFYGNLFDPNKYRHGLYGLMIGQRMAGMVSLSGLQCGWDHMRAPPGHDVACMRMLVNIYIYAMIHAG